MKNYSKNIENQTSNKISNFYYGQKVLYRICEPPYDVVKEYKGVVKEVHTDYLIVDIPEISDHCRFEDFNLPFLLAAPMSANERLAHDIFETIYNIESSTAEDECRMTSELADELDHCGEDAFLIRQVLKDIISILHPFSIYRGDVTEVAWDEIMDALDIDENNETDEILIRGFFVDKI